MSVPVAVHLEQRTGSLCVFCRRGPAHIIVVHLESNEAEIGPICLNCMCTRMMHGVIEPPPAVRPKIKKIKKHSRQQEKEVMDDIGGFTQPGSGCVPGYKSDGRLQGIVRMEAKFTYGNIFSLRKADLDKVRGECEGREIPSLVVDFKDSASGKTRDSWVLITRTQWENFIRAISNDS
jgi:hypothetical protein